MKWSNASENGRIVGRLGLFIWFSRKSVGGELKLAS